MSETKPKILKRRQFGDSILHEKARRLTVDEIKSDAIQKLITDMRYTLDARKLGVGLAAPQVGESVALSIISIKSRDSMADFEQAIINPEIVEYLGKPEYKWEGCLSFGSETEPPFAQTVRHKKIRVRYYDETGEFHEETLSGFPAHIFQHETDHLNGVLFPERVEDHSTWMNMSEYRKFIQQLRAKAAAQSGTIETSKDSEQHKEN